MNLLDALNITNADIVAFVGGGGKTTAMFRLAAEIAAGGGRVFTTTTTRIFAAQIKLAPAYLLAAEATRGKISAAQNVHRQLLVIGELESSSGKAMGVSAAFITQLRRDFPEIPILIEADGSRMRPFKAPAAHEPVIPPEATHVVIVVGADALGQPLTDQHVHRAEIVSQLSGTPLGSPLTPTIIARTLTHPAGGLKNVPPQAKVSVLINKVDMLENWADVEALEWELLENWRIKRVVLAALKIGQILKVSHYNK